MNTSYLYILTNQERTLLHIDATSDITERIGFHRHSVGHDIAKKHRLNHLIYIENFPNLELALARRRQLRCQRKRRKWQLIQSANPKLAELASVAPNT